MKTLLKNNIGTTAVEFALVALPVFMLMIGIIQTAFIMWTDNLLFVSVDTAARCGAVQSQTPPCQGLMTLANMQATANTVFLPLSGANFALNPTCGGSGLVGTKIVNILYVVNLTLTAKSCYPDLGP
jgi:Flp pilus assembly pilin Flp